MNRINSIQFFEDCFHLAPLFGMGTQSAIGLYKIYNRYVSLVTGDFMMMTEGSKACKKYDEAKFVRPAVHRAKAIAVHVSTADDSKEMKWLLLRKKSFSIRR